MYLSMKLSICIFLAFTACAFSATNSDSQQAPSFTGALLVNLATEIKVTNSYAETTYTYKLSTSSQEPLEIAFNLPSLERTSFLSLSATLHNEVKNSLIVDPHKLKPNTDDSQHALDLNSPNSIKIGTIAAGETGVVVLSVMEEFESQRDNVWSLTLPSDLFTGPFFVNNEQVSSLESWNINVVNDNHYSLIQDSKLNQVKKGENNISWTIKKGDSSLKTDITLNFKETQFPGWNAILVKHPEYDHDYVLRLDFALDEEVKSKEKIRGSMSLQDVSLQPKPETQKDLPFARDEFIFVIDRSKAIQGENFENLKMMLKKTISKLPMKAFFNIVSFVTKFHFYKFESIQLTEETKQEALEWVSSLQEGSGNSIIDNPVKIATTIPRKDNHLRSMLLFSGKDAANNNEMLNYMEENCRYIRFCHINIGDQGFENLHGDIENVGRCMSASVKDKEEANDKAEHLIEIITYPHLEGITLLVDCFDSDNHSLFLQEDAWNYLSHNQPLRKWFYAHTTKDIHHCTGNFRFTNDTNKQTYQYSFSISVDKQVNNPIWHKVAYTALERMLAIKARHAPEGGSKQIMITHIKDMAVRYQVFSEYAATLLTNKGQDEVVVRSSKRNLGTDAIADEDNLDPTTSNLMNKMFKQEEPEEKIDPAEEEARRIEDSKRTDDILMKLVIGIGVVMLVLYVVGKVFISKYEKENAALKEEQEQLEKQFYDKFNKKKKQ